MLHFMKYLNVTARCAAEYRNEQLKDVGLCGLQYSYILNICRSPGVNQEELSHLIHVNKSNVTRQLNVLEENGFIERKTSPNDKRSTLVYPTEKAYNALPAIHRVLDEWSRLLTEDFTEEERETIGRLMERIAQKAIAYMEGSGNP